MTCVYNRYKGGVDFRNRLIALYRLKRKNVAWWRPVFLRMFDNAIVNAYIIYRMNHKD